jgi:hypothetical protein
MIRAVCRHLCDHGTALPARRFLCGRHQNIDRVRDPGHDIVDRRHIVGARTHAHVQLLTTAGHPAAVRFGFESKSRRADAQCAVPPQASVSDQGASIPTIRAELPALQGMQHPNPAPSHGWRIRNDWRIIAL